MVSRTFFIDGDRRFVDEKLLVAADFPYLVCLAHVGFFPLCPVNPG